MPARMRNRIASSVCAISVVSEDMSTKQGGVYAISNQVNGKRYVGSAVNVRKRWQIHLARLRHEHHSNPHLQAAFLKYGEEAFVLSLLEQVEDTGRLIVCEQYFLDTLKPEYNIASVAGSPLGVRRTEETRRKLSKIATGRHVSEETRRKMSEAHKGKHLSDETKRKMSKAHKGKPLSAEHKQKLSAAHKGKHFTAEHCRNISTARKAYWRRVRALSG